MLLKDKSSNKKNIMNLGHLFAIGVNLDMMKTV